jgi:hypothetical protein
VRAYAPAMVDRFGVSPYRDGHAGSGTHG